jgi:2-oxoglutarate dehydrogenase E1 component
MGPGTRFHRVIAETDSLAADEKVGRLVLCTGKVYYDLVQERRNRGIENVAIARVEQLYPWPRQNILDQIARYPNAQVVWCQEEPANMGAWTFVLPRLINILEELERQVFVPTYVGRKAAASPATGLFKTHVKEQEQLVDQALTLDLKSIPQPFRRVSR